MSWLSCKCGFFSQFGSPSHVDLHLNEHTNLKSRGSKSRIDLICNANGLTLGPNAQKSSSILAFENTWVFSVCDIDTNNSKK